MTPVYLLKECGKMKRRELKEIIRGLVREISLTEDGIGSSAGAMPANVTSNIGGYDGPLSKRVVRRKKAKPIIKLGGKK